MKAFIIGGTGFIGKYLCEALLQRGIFCAVLARPTSNTGFLEGRKDAEIVYGDITDAGSLAAVVPHDADICFHAAAYVGDLPRRSLLRINAEGTQNVLETCLRKGIPRAVYLSSAAVLGGNQQVPLTDDMPYAAVDEYGLSKIEAEKIALSYRRKGLKVAVFRPPAVYGEGEPHMLGLIMRLLKLRMLFLLGEAQQQWHLVYVKNVVSALMLALDNEQAFEGVYLVADRQVLTVREVFTIVSDAIGVKPPLSIPSLFVPLMMRLPYLGKKLETFSKDWVYSLQRIETMLGYNPPYAAPEALRKTAEYYRTKA